MMVLMVASRILGLLRNWFLAGHFGAGGELDAYTIAFVFPDILANILITGALSVAFIPIFASFITRGSKDEAWDLASSVLNLSLITFFIFGIIIFVFAPYFLNLFGLEPEFVPLAVTLTRIITLGELLLVLGSFFSSVLQSYYRFIIPAIAPVLYNLGIIFGIVFLSPFFGIIGAALGVLVGAFLHAISQIFVLQKLQFHYRIRVDLKNPEVLKVLKLSLPRALGVGVSQLEWAVSIFLASLLATGSVAILKFAQDLQNFPIGIFGLTLATAALPTLSTEWASNKLEDFKTTFLSSLHQILYLSVPMSVILAVLRIPIVRLALGTGKFDWPATVATATTMSYFAVGIFAQAAFLLTARAFYSMHDTVTPFKIGSISLIIHVILSSSLLFIFGETAAIKVSFIGLSAAISGIFSFLTSLYLLDRRVGKFDRVKLFLPALKIIIASGAMAVLLYLPLHIKINGHYIIDLIIDTTRAVNLLFLTGAVATAGLGVYILLTWWFKSDELKAYLRLVPDITKFKGFVALKETIQTTKTTPT